ncbi:class I adenylate-forming enzyme family protein [Shewanella scandinavica]|uniref:Class I adenylate-forming enzyme family protein n=1 Tax=Shewanella scandinavica TaxID=3063538 RepID=A0ABU3FTQ9_9GAMM|nr:class I adenylate-forming enzyme family protein [Shewanella sp. SP2S1-2]MDT3278765.1 class I adenylate-forming enzyme family protein [Shewanella sp. SP2S1-2]
MSCLYERFRLVAQQFHDKTALIDGDECYTYGQLLSLIELWCKQIVLICQTQRPRVALLTDSLLHSFTVSVAIAKLDGACIPTNAQMLAPQLLAGWNATDVNLVVYDRSVSAKVHSLALPFGIIATDALAIPTGNIPANHNTYANNIEFTQDDCHASEALSSLVQEAIDNDFLITLSSGSTGDPKPIVVSQSVKLARAQQTWDLYHLTSDDVVLCASPFFHSLGQRLSFVPLLLGATLVRLAPFTPKQWLVLVEQHAVSFVISVSSHLYALKDELLDNAIALKSLKTIVTSSAPIDAAFKEKIFDAIGCDFHEIYGATEIAVATNLAPCDAKFKFNTVGYPCEAIDVQILNSNLCVCGINEVGEIAVRSPLAFSGYYHKPELTLAAWHGDYFLTGDLGKLDSEGFLTYVGRKKDVIISGGINIYPKDIEAVLSTHERVLEVAVIGVDDQLLGEVIVAICIVKDADRLEPQLRALTNRSLAPFQRPLKYFFPEKLPLTATGKVSKKLLREQYNSLNNGWTAVLETMLYGRKG